MKKKRRNIASINAGTMADIAFLLLIFFLVATQISQDKGVRVVLPEYYDGPVGQASDNNVLNIKINKSDELMIEGEVANISELNEMVATFVLNPLKKSDYPTSPQKAIISLQNDVETSYETYVYVYSIIQSAYRNMRRDYSITIYGKDLALLDKKQTNEIKRLLPMKISEAEPFDL